MSIYTEYERKVLHCDICDETEVKFDTFQDAIDFKKDKSNGWVSRKTEDGWYDVCSECRTKKYI